jgi:hypothetical protein
MGGMDKSKELATNRIDRERYKAYLQLLELTMPQRFE